MRGILQRAPVAVGVGADADEGRGKDSKSKNRGEDSEVHDVVLLWRAQPCAAPIPFLGVVGGVSSVQAVMRS